MKRSRFVKNTVKYGFLGMASIVGVLLAVSTVKKHGTKIKKKSRKLLIDARRNIKSSRDKLNERQRRLLKLFDKFDKVSKEMIIAEIPAVSERTIRRDLDDLEKRQYVRQIGKTKGSYYVAK